MGFGRGGMFMLGVDALLSEDMFIDLPAFIYQQIGLSPAQL